MSGAGARDGVKAGESVRKGKFKDSQRVGDAKRDKQKQKQRRDKQKEQEKGTRVGPSEQLLPATTSPSPTPANLGTVAGGGGRWVHVPN